MVEKQRDPTEPAKTSSAVPPRAGTATQISRESIRVLGEKLDEFGKQLSEDEQLTLCTTFALAARAFQTFPGLVACEQGLRVAMGQGGITVERLTGASSAAPKLSETLTDALCPGGASQFSIEGLEVDRPMYGAKSVAAGAKSVAACRMPGMLGAKSVAAGMCRTPGMAGAKSVAAGMCRTPGMAGAKSVAAGMCRTPGMAGAKSVAAGMCRTPGMAGAKSVAAACRMPGMAGAKSVAAGMCRMPGYSGY
jgi:hypothetical protein